MILMSGALAYPHDPGPRAPHGGKLYVSGSYYLEMLVYPGEIRLYVLNRRLEPISAKEIDGTLLIRFPDNTNKTVALEPSENFLKAPIAPEKEFTATATLKIVGKTHVGRFSFF